MENSLHYLGESLNHVMQFQQNVNRNMVEHLNMTQKINYSKVRLWGGW